MIPEAAVEAAAKAAYAGDWGSLHSAAQNVRRSIARTHLEAAAPHMLTRVTNAVINRAFEDGQRAALDRLAAAYDEGLEAGDGLRPRGNPYL